ncbi:uncharacterized protein OCT59_010598 [Rhizophagus irregularis]|uniref:Uncharacterized protein n=2 Tax=Rhizophagus irregularis TaxID=588596 RepID=U9TQL4_RHIID|nr:hypothetical protein GLOIN_2v1482143 [Rhizophagus irregularis DAOM 181602=DAOM 197198]EXX68808.1 hypothetical protein RirG_101750 [Rhizophagus irregularis DAOM 197198w]UZO19301.1 hypothetical protein OCT59_010598 [Rhizophagus irregularis]POG66732.1 hypothetical protein GLOIN_2v1482143 [Rhizophagus irregularis DAOM 181602=DAOM 197198]CAG8720402.1 11824_t:CDS:1 [Rhizophagus irregularis]GBC13284.1 hypothetical protein GLOIN_2v1482143 [Rhizophagus irregularis DAOM 181602=DAOM 197198]|eukprot:XP_025173598.1 hypothetical protein GLOIN_2v1482143 [Rhizophagus irregularis DAOM 181602=DAOM 197198]
MVTNDNLSHVVSSISQDDISTTPRQLVQDHQILTTEDINSQDVISNFFYKPPNDYQIYDISYRETSISFELISELLDNNNNSYLAQNHVQPNNLHEFYFLKVEEKKCYKVTCVLIPHLSIVEYLNKNIHGVEFNHNEQQQEIYVEFSRELKENLEYYLKQFLAPK